MITRPELPATAPLEPLVLDMQAADSVMTCHGLGLRAYAEAGGLDPAVDFRGLDLRGVDLTEQDLSGFDLSGCDLRDTGVEFAKTDAETRLDDAVLDEASELRERAQPRLTRQDLDAIIDKARGLYENNDATSNAALADAGLVLLPLLEDQFGVDDSDVLTVALFVGCGAVRSGESASGRERLQTMIARWTATGGREDDWQVLLARFDSAEALSDLDREAEAFAEFDALLPLDEAVNGPRDNSTLNTRQSRARTLLDMGRPVEALAEFDALLPLEEAIRGPLKRSALNVRHYRARALLDLGHAQQALQMFDTIVAGCVAIKGERHWWTAFTRSNQLAARMAMGQWDFADEFERIVEHFVREQQTLSKRTLRTRYRRARCLAQSGCVSAARVEIAGVLEGYDRSGIRFDRYQAATLRLRDHLDGLDDGVGLLF